MDKNTVIESNSKIFVIVVTYNGKRWYDRCFGSLRDSTIPVTAIAIDNASNDGSAQYIKEHFPEVLLIENDRNLGFGNANNLGLKYALQHDCDYAFLLNQDAWVDADMMEKLINVAVIHKEYGLLCPLFLNTNRTSISTTLSTKTVRNGEIMFSDLFFRGKLQDVYTNDYSINAAGWLLPKATLMTIGGFTPLIFHYGEDDDYLNRLKYHKLLIGVVPAALMVHDHVEKVDGSRDLFIKSNLDVPEEYLDINIPDNALTCKRKYLMKTIKSVLKRNMQYAGLCWHRYKYINAHQMEIDCSREQNRIKQPNWIQ